MAKSISQGLEAVRSGDRSAFISAFEKEINALYRFIARELRYHEALGDIYPGELLPEDILDEVALRALRRAREIPRWATFKGWLRQVALNVIREQAYQLRAQRWLEAVSLQDPLPAGNEYGEWYQPDAALIWEDVLPAPVSTPEEVLELHETRQELERALNSLPPDQRLVFVLHAIEGLSYAEVGAILHRPPNWIKAAYHAARETLRQRFSGRFSPPDNLSARQATPQTSDQQLSGKSK